MNKKIIFVILFMLLGTGCATNIQLYEWGEYEETLFAVYNNPAHKEQLLNNYFVFVRKQERRKALAPGLYAEAGTFLLEQGDIEGALIFYKMEYEHWPESQPMLGILIANLEAKL